MSICITFVDVVTHYVLDGSGTVVTSESSIDNGHRYGSQNDSLLISASLGSAGEGHSPVVTFAADLGLASAYFTCLEDLFDAVTAATDALATLTVGRKNGHHIANTTKEFYSPN